MKSTLLLVITISILFCQAVPLHSENHIGNISGADFFINNSSSDDIPSEATQQMGDAMGAFAKLSESGNYTTSLNINDLSRLPVGIRENRDNVEYGIVVTKAKFTPDYAMIDVYARIVTPQQGGSNGKKELYFGAEGIKFSYQGDIVGEAKLSMLGNVEIPFNNNEWMLTIEGGAIAKAAGGASINDKTYAIIGCDGIKQLSLTGNVQISRNLLVPVDADGHLIESETVQINGKTVPNRVRGEFAAVASDWNDLLVEINLTPFAIAAQTKSSDKGYFSFAVNEAIMDLSDIRNFPSVVFPDEYQENPNKYFIDNNTNTWRGLYVQSLTVRMPEEFKTSSDPNRLLSFQAQDMLIDGYGVSGAFSALNLLPLNEGITSTESAWAFSVDNVGVTLSASKIKSGHLSGQIQVPGKPTAQDSTANTFGYAGLITDDSYQLAVSVQQPKRFDIFGAVGTIQPGSTVELAVKQRTFVPKAILTGNLALKVNADATENNTDTTNSDLKTVLEFQNLTIQTVQPYLTVGYLGAKGEHKLGGLPISINDIYLQTTAVETKLGFGITVGLQDNGFSASGSVVLEGEIAGDNNRFVWHYKGFTLSRLALENVDVKVATISGELELMRNDPIYGKGFRAFLSAKIKGLSDNTGVTVNAIFGRSTFRYWGFEGAVSGLNIPAGYITLTGFSGGAFYRMIPQGSSITGKTMTFLPDSTINLALAAGVSGCFQKDDVANFMANFNVLTNAGGGLASIGFNGEALVMAKLTDAFAEPFQKLQDKFKQTLGKASFINDLQNNNHVNSFLDAGQVDNYYPTETSKPSTIYGKMAMSYDFNSNVFHANAEVFVNTPGGFISGTGQNGRAGWAVMHFGAGEWYIHIGTPSDMVGLKMGIAGISVRTGSYFMVGTNIPGSPPPPATVAQILGTSIEDLDYMGDLNKLGLGKGFAFGTHFSYDTGDMTVAILYARFAAGIGGDVMLKNYETASCANGNGEQIGFNGWYANGQAYVYLTGELGVRVKVFGYKKKFPIIKAGTAALLQIKAPNPVWVRGMLAGNYNFLGGLVKGKFKFDMQFGEECDLIEGQEEVLGGIKIIADLAPTDNETEVNVFAIPQATFNMGVNEIIELDEDDGKHTYKIVLDKFAVLDSETGQEIQGEVSFEDGGSTANFTSKDILPPSKSLKAVVAVSFMEKINGIFQVLMIDGQKATETAERNFTTGDAPPYIPLENIQYAYPVAEQENFYTDEGSNGYIRLKRGQPYLFEDANWTTQSRFIDEQDNSLQSTFAYSAADNELSFDIPVLQKTKYYSFLISAKPKGNSTAAAAQTVTETNTYGDSEDATTFEVESRQAQKLTKDGEIERLTYTFRTSNFNTLSEKITALSFNTVAGYISSGLVFLQNHINGTEYFDKTELAGSQYTDNKPLIDAAAVLSENFADKFKNLFYNEYPAAGITLDRAGNTDDNAGIPPARALPIVNGYMNYLQTQNWNALLKQYFPYNYDVFRYYRNDWYEISAKAAGLFVNGNTSPKVIELMNSNFGVIPVGTYSVKIKYLMPGSHAGTETTIPYIFTY
ncbi:MAG: hypothetical protein LBS01_07980 [Prevotellaceae bacterium]|jgi:hypothetical protein|nr:hypothetical protein [Prevotellaceae bacterium]